MTGRDDDALSWAGDDDPTLVSAPGADYAEASTTHQPHATPAADDPAPLPSVQRADDVDAEPLLGSDADGETDGAPAAMSSAALVSLGVLGGVYLLYTVGWIVGGLRLNEIAGFIVAPAASVPAVIVAIAAPALWFGVAFVLTRHRPTWQRFAWLVAGAVLLVPWPFAMLGTGM